MKATILLGSRRPPAALLDALSDHGLEQPGFPLAAATACERLRAGGVWLVIADAASLRSPDIVGALRAAGNPPVVQLDGGDAGPLRLPDEPSAADVAAVLGELPARWSALRPALVAAVAAELAEGPGGPLAPRVRGLIARLAQALGASRLAVFAPEGGPGQILPRLAATGDDGGIPDEVCIGAEDAGRIVAARQPARLGGDLLVPMVSGDRVRGLLWLTAPAAADEPLALAAAALLAVAIDGSAARRGDGAVTLDGEQRMWVEKLASLGQLAAGIAHEINNPLFVISGNLELAMRGVTGSSKNLLDKALAAADRIRRIVFEMRQFYLPASHSERVVPIDVNALIENAIDVISLQAPFKGVTFEQDLDLSIPQVPGDDNQLLQVLTHLFLNSAQAMPSGGVITVRTRSDGKAVTIQVADVGIGIPKANQSRIFDPFFTTKQDWLGTGLGLSVSHTIVRNHGGTIELESDEGKGATFTVRLPAAVAQPARPASKGGTRIRRVLVADDEETVRDFLEYLMREIGYQVDVAKDGAAALAMLEREAYGVVLMDHLMPGTSGREIGREIVAKYPELPVVLVTGMVSVDLDEFKREGFFRVLAKPCKADDIIDCVKAAIEGS